MLQVLASHSKPWVVRKPCIVMSDSFARPPQTVAHQTPLSMEFSRQEYWNGLPFLTPGDLCNPGIEPTFLASSALAGRFFTTVPPGYQYDRLENLPGSQVQANSLMNTTIWPRVLIGLLSHEGVLQFMQNISIHFYWMINNLTMRVQRWQDTIPRILWQCIYVYQVFTLCILNIVQFYLPIIP